MDCYPKKKGWRELLQNLAWEECIIWWGAICNVSAKDLTGGFSKSAQEVKLGFSNYRIHFGKTSTIYSWTCYQHSSINRFITASTCILSSKQNSITFPLKKTQDISFPYKLPTHSSTDSIICSRAWKVCNDTHNKKPNIKFHFWFYSFDQTNPLINLWIPVTTSPYLWSSDLII